MYKISIYWCAMFKKLVCQWVKVLSRKKGSTKLRRTTAANPVSESTHTSHSGVDG